MESMERLYTYVDETGQDPEGVFFLVAIVVVGRERDALLQWLERIEQETGKGVRSWHRSRHPVRMGLHRSDSRGSQVRGAVYYATYAHTRTYQDLTLLTIGKALGERMRGRRYKVTVIIDGLARQQTRQVAVGLRRIRIPLRKVRGARDESNALVRLADAMAGFLRAAEEGRDEWRERLARAKTRGTITKV